MDKKERGIPHEKKRRHQAATRLSTEAIVARTSPWLSLPIRRSLMHRSNQYHEFVQTDVLGLDMGGVTCLFVTIDHTYLNSNTKALIASPTTKLVVAEYFAPDLARHGLYDTKTTTGNYLKNSLKLQFAHLLADTCRDAQKPVAVADIANRPLYEALYEASRFELPAISVSAGAIAFEHGYPLLGTLLAVPHINAILNSLQEKIGKGIFNPKKVSKFERLFTDYEQARRLLVAKALEQTAQDMRETIPGKEKGTMLVLYPRAHGIRIADMLEHPKPIADTLRGILYKGISLPLEDTVRRYGYHDGWRLESTEKIRVLPQRDKR